MNNVDILEEELRKDILYQIDMKLYDEFNDKFCEIEENLGTVYSYKDLEDLKKAESDTERTLLREAISTLIAENKELKEEIEELKNEQSEVKISVSAHNRIMQLEEENARLKNKNSFDVYKMGQESQRSRIECDYIPKSKVKEVIEEVKEDENPSISSFQEYAQEYAIDKLQSLLGKE